LRVRARAGPGGRAEVERLIAREDVAPEDVCVLVRSVRSEGQAVGGRVRGARGARTACRRGGVLPARRGARPAGLAAAARRPGDAGRGRARARAPPVELRRSTSRA
jgi:DNA helicase-2/ATP-dependent DNA helicase PcrA